MLPRLHALSLINGICLISFRFFVKRSYENIKSVFSLSESYSGGGISDIVSFSWLRLPCRHQIRLALLTQNAMTPCACAHHTPHRSTLSAQMHPIQVLLFPLRVLIPHKPMHVWPNQKKNLKVPKKMPCPTDPKCNDPLRLCSPHTPQINPKRPNAPDSSFTIPP